MAYSTIKYGSSGDDVKTLQTYLNNNGYKLDVDGQFGSKTQAAVKDYQSKNNLFVDGIVGKNTWGSLTSGKSTALKSTSNNSSAATTASKSTSNNSSAATTASKATSNNSSAATTASRPTYTKSDTLTAAEKTLAEWEAAKPAEYQSQYSDDINALLDSILNGTYDPNNDELFNIYKEQYEKNGKLAMQDAMAQAAELTGGYGSSYGTAAAQQTYQQYLTELNNMIPELAEQSRNSKIQNLSLLQQQDDSDYGKYRDSVDDYYTQGDYLYQKAADISDEEWQQYLQLVDEYEYDQAFDYQKERDKVSDDQWQKSFDYQKERDKVADDQWQKSYDLSKTSASRSSSDDGPSGYKTPEDYMYDEALAAYKEGGQQALNAYVAKYPDYDIDKLMNYATTYGGSSDSKTVYNNRVGNKDYANGATGRDSFDSSVRSNYSNRKKK